LLETLIASGTSLLRVSETNQSTAQLTFSWDNIVDHCLHHAQACSHTTCHMAISALSAMSFHTGKDDCVSFGSVVGLHLIEVEVKVVGGRRGDGAS
jgi:hypothetical protein